MSEVQSFLSLRTPCLSYQLLKLNLINSNAQTQWKLWEMVVLLTSSFMQWGSGEPCRPLPPVEGHLKQASSVPSVVSDSCDPADCGPPGSSVHGILQGEDLFGE